MLTVHHLDNSRSQRVLWLLEELELSYELVSHPHPKQAHQASASLKKIHPLAKAPIVCDGELVIAETGAIFEYLIDTYAHQRLQPPLATVARLDYNYWRHFSEASFMPYLAMKLLFSAMQQKTPWPAKLIIRFIARTVEKLYLNPNIYAELDYIEAHLSKQRWFAGDEFSAADILISFPIEAVAVSMAAANKYPYIHDFVNRIRSRPAYARAVNKGAWSKAEHEQYWAGLGH